MLRRLIRWGYRRLLHPSARNSLQLTLLLAEHDRAPEPITDFTASRVLVLAPHMDDEVIGCGGVVARHAAAGARVAVAYMTDGRGSASFPPGVTGAKIAASRREVCATRRREAQAAAAILGIEELYFLDAVDGSLRPDDVVVEALARRVTELRPEIIYLPFAMDMHGDHWQTNLVFAASVDRLPPGLLQARTTASRPTGTSGCRKRRFSPTRACSPGRSGGSSTDDAPGYLADHWCNKGHILLCLEDRLDTKLVEVPQPVPESRV